jgi:hypothetical protein
MVKKIGGSQQRIAIALAVMGIVVLQLYLTMTWRLDQSDCSSSPFVSHHSISVFPGNKQSSNSTALILDLSQTNFGGIQARSFESWEGPLPCVEPEPNWPLTQVQRSPAHEGFFMVKEMKTGSSTATGINLRIARNVARRYFSQFKICKLRNDHATADKLEYNLRDRKKSFLWTIIRDPKARAVSQFFHFQVSRNKVEPTDQKFQNWIQTDQWMYRYYLRTLSVETQADVWNANYDPVAAANKIIQDYDIIGVTERMDESAVALQFLLGLTTGDILYTNAKNSGGFDDGASDQGCVYIVPSFISKGMNDYFKSPMFRSLTASDTFLHRAANRSLDLTIQRVGQERFEKALQRFRFAQQRVKETCIPAVTFPCSASGEKMERPDCFWGDSGCGTGCLDELANEMNLYDQ